MKQIAEHLGISRTTVSLVLKGAGDQYRISPSTQQRILSYARSSGYRPNYFASALNSRHSKVIAAIFPDVFESFMGRIVKGMESVLYEQGYSLMLSTSRFDPERERSLIDSMLYRGCDGLVLIPTMPYSHEPPYDSSYIRDIVSEAPPIVLVDRTIPDITLPCVLQLDYRRTAEALTPAAESGCRNIVCISFDLQASSIRDRLRGYSDVMKYYGLQEQVFFLTSQDPTSGDLTEYLDSLETMPDLFFVTTSGLADKLSFLLKQRCSTAPIIRFGSSAPWSMDTMTDIPQPHEAMGAEAARLLLSCINDGWRYEKVLC